MCRHARDGGRVYYAASTESGDLENYPKQASCSPGAQALGQQDSLRIEVTGKGNFFLAHIPDQL